MCALFCVRSEQSPKWPASSVHEGPVCGAVSDSASPSQLSAALPASSHGPTRLRSQRLTDFGQPGEIYWMVVWGGGRAGGVSSARKAVYLGL